MMAELSKYNGIQPILTTVIPLREDAQDSLEKNEDYEYYPVMDSLQYYNKWLRNYAAQNDFILIDFNELLSDQNGFLPIKYSSGLIDLNEKGYEVISKYTLSVLHKELTRSK
jgi:lysophospholipase L1-like esterase